MDFIKESMQLPIDNLVGLLLYAVIYMFSAGLFVVLALTFIPNRLPYAVKSAIVGIAVLVSLVFWWNNIL
ncbi:hypothetical protein GH741_03745 [Aquibacillus halophilus]|uniref:Uncharacterized protein n=1 Tax=Aquibacillus halophilus TaxID=930132 RepID=A0A6A8D860_9BACI|nr:hypothetical protein [Aquibacillus halophilus]MRH41784.1 hypothetical protein [Aquibacillus halophilus]